MRRGLRRYVGARMHRRLFVWFGIAIVATASTVVGTLHVFGDNSRGWRTERSRVESFLSGQYVRVWNHESDRRELSRSLSSTMQFGVRVRDAQSRTLDQVDMPTPCRHGFSIPIRENSGVKIGDLDICMDQRHGVFPGWLGLFALVAAACVLWGIAGKVARKISRPLGELTLVAREIGEGNLASRVRLCGGMHFRRDEVGELSEAVNEMATRIEQQLRDQRELLATVSHELRTPLQRIRILLELAAAQGTSRKVLDEIDGEVVEMDALVGDLLASARVEFAALSPRALDPGEVARRASERSGMSGVSVEVAPNVGSLMADATLLSRALAAVLDNARKYGGDRILIRVEALNDGVAFVVEDNGHGFAPGDEEKVLEPFYRGSQPGIEEARGVGLGLALVRRIAVAHGGRVYAENLAGGGARVAIELPRVPRARRPA